MAFRKPEEMKFQVESHGHSEYIQRALFRRGIGWAGLYKTKEFEVQHTGAAYLYVDSERHIRHGQSQRVFNDDPATEYVYRLGLVRPRVDDEPLEQVPMPVFHAEAQRLVGGGDLSDVDRIDSRTLEIDIDPTGELAGGGKVISLGEFHQRLREDCPKSTPTPEPPIGLRPGWVVWEERRDEIVKAIDRYAADNFTIPAGWFVELNEVIEKIRKLEKTA